MIFLCGVLVGVVAGVAGVMFNHYHKQCAEEFDLTCQKCLCSRSDDVLGGMCRTPGCDGVITEQPKFSDVTVELPELMTCGRRHETSGPNLDHWNKFKTNGNRVCSYCGSLHPDDLFDLVKQSSEAPLEAPYNSVIEVEPSDKSYKVYIHQPGVRNAMEGGIKFYTHHLPRDAKGNLAVTQQRQDEYATAVRHSNIRFERDIMSRGRVSQ